MVFVFRALQSVVRGTAVLASGKVDRLRMCDVLVYLVSARSIVQVAKLSEYTLTWKTSRFLVLVPSYLTAFVLLDQPAKRKSHY